MKVIGLAPGARLQASIDRQGRLVLVPSKDELEDLFLQRPKVNRRLSHEQMEQAITAAAGRGADRRRSAAAASTHPMSCWRRRP